MKLPLFFCLCFSSLLVMGQTSPAAFDLSSGNYSFNAWDSASAAGTYPPSMVFHTFTTGNTDAATVATADWICGYNLGSRPRFIGRNSNGVAFLNTGSSQFSTCAANGDTSNVFVGDITLAINTTGRDNIQLSWVGRMLSAFSFNDTSSNPVNRFFGITCQYRIGSSGAFTAMPLDSIFVCNLNDSTYHPEFFSDTIGPITLPDFLENQPLIEIRWIYHRTNAGQGPRPELALDDISLTSDIFTGVQSLNKGLTLVTNTLSGPDGFILHRPGQYELYDCFGRLVQRYEQTSIIPAAALSPGFYFISSTASGQSQKVFVRP